MRRFAPVLGLLLAGCAAAPAPAVREEGTWRLFDGQRVMGHYVSPAAYAHYMAAQLAALDGRNEEAAGELARAIASDGTSPYLRTRLAEELLAMGHLDEARESLETALRFDPAFAPALVGLGRIALRLGDPQGAEASFRRAMELDRGCEEAYLELASLYRERGESARADSVFRAMAERLPRTLAAHLALARSALAHGELRAAEAALGHALEIDPASLEARIELGRMLFADNRVAEAETELRAAWLRSGRDPRVAEPLVMVEVALGRPEEADAILGRLAAQPARPERRLRLGWMWLERRHGEEALAVADELLATVETPQARLLRGAALALLGNGPAAVAELMKIAASASEFVPAQLRIAKLTEAGGKTRDAIEQLSRAVQQAADRPDVDLLNGQLALLYERGGDRARARTLIESALRLRPASDVLLYAMGRLLERGGELDRAVDVVRSIVERSPDNAEALNFLGWSWTERGIRLKEAQKLLERAAALRPTSGEIADSLGWLYYKVDRLDDAERLLERAERFLPDAADTLRHLGDVYVKRGDRARALAIFRRALAKNPDPQTRQAVEQRLVHLEEGRLGSR